MRVNLRESKVNYFERGVYQYTSVSIGGNHIRNEFNESLRNDYQFMAQNDDVDFIRMPYFDELGLSVTFLDDGCIHVNNFDIESVQVLADGGNETAKIMLFSYMQGSQTRVVS